MKRNLLLLMLTMMVMTTVIIIDYLKWFYLKCESIHPYLAYSYLLVVAIAVVYFFVIPLWKIFTAPSIPSLQADRLPIDKDELYHLGLILAKNNKHLRPDQRKLYRTKFIRQLENQRGQNAEMSKLIVTEIKNRTDLINQEIKEQALSVFLIIGLSQNGKFDFVTNLIINLRLIHKIIHLSGFRPSYSQIFRIYTEVLMASFITDVSEEMLDDIDFSSVVEAIHLPAIFLKSFIDGSMSALMTLRIGYITKLYIVRGTDKIRDVQKNREIRKGIRHEAIVSALSIYPALAKEAGSKIGKSSFSFFGGYLKNLFLGPFSSETKNKRS